MDLNLLRTFVALYETRSLTVAARRLFVSQPAASQALAKLRTALDDPLFERIGRTMVPTRLADSLYPEFRAALVRIDDSVSDARAFDAAGTRRRFRIALSELGELAFLRPILQAVRSHAPRAGLDVVPLDIRALPGWLAQGTVDLAVTSSPVAGDFEAATVKPETYVVLMPAAHPLADRALSLAEYAAAGHIVVVSDSGMPRITDALARAGVDITPVARVNHYSALASVLLAGDFVATAPASFVAPWARTLPIVVRPLPIEVAPVEVRLLMRATSEQRAALTWLHRTVLDAMHTVPAENWAPAL
ncbi:LysR family transcriptional regulator [Microbacterium rhizophilus]|uniref:LysR family transcriptional regulator n=1 Tax=Microbacterium rhizophilus TaxID=3138934 RepID=UPI0031EFBCCA